MTKLTVYEHGEYLQELELEVGQEYILGRSSSCHVVLAHAEFSRQHLKVFHNGDHWMCLVLSKFSKIKVKGESMTELSLADGATFSMPPYEFRFEQTQDLAAPIEEPAPETQQDPTPQAEPEKTNVASISLTPILIRLGNRDQAKDEIPITQDVILEAGRSRSCQIQLHDPKASRKHFTIEYRNGEVILKDLGSANQTYVNGEAVGEVHLRSGDSIEVGEDRFRLELVNPEFSNLPAPISKLEDTHPAVIKVNIDQLALVPHRPADPIPQDGPPYHSRKPKKNANLIYLMAIFLAILAWGVLYKEEPKQDLSRNPATANPQGSPSKQNADATHLTPEQVKFLDETLRLADHLYRNQKPELALQKLADIFRMVPDYKNARTLEGLSQQLYDLQQQALEEQRLARQREETLEKASSILDECDQLFRAKRYTEIEGCVGRIADLDPENNRGQELISKANEMLENQENAKQDRIEAAQRKERAKALFETARSDFNAGNYITAKSKFIGVTNIPFNDTDGLKAKAQTGVTESTKRIQDQVDNLVRDGRKSLEVKDYKKAVESFDKALAIQTSNGDAKILKDRALKEINSEMKTLYQEAILDESVGNIDSALAKWKKIIEVSPKSNEYHGKAKIKLGKYEK